MITYTATLRYTQELGSKVSWYWVRRKFGYSTVICSLALALTLVWLFFWDDYNSFFWVMGLSLAACIGIYFWCAYQSSRRWKRALSAMGKPEAQLVLTEDSFAVSSGAGSSTIPWRRFTKIWKQPDFWMLFLDSGYPVTLPLAGVSPEVLELIEEKIAKAKKAAG
jgi:hypothetical protein